MSSSHPENSNGLELRLQIRYHGLKATQYFTKFTLESQAVLREDLIVLKLPHPKKEHMNLLSHGCVECVWYNVQPNHVLHKNVALKSENPDEKMLRRLSITKVVLKEIWHGRAPKPKNGLKRPPPPSHPGYGPPSVPAPPLWGAPALPTSSGPDSSGRPSKYARIDHGDVSSISLSSSSKFPPKPPPPTNTNTNADANSFLNSIRVRLPQTHNSSNQPIPDANMQRKVSARTALSNPHPLRTQDQPREFQSFRIKHEEVEHILLAPPPPQPPTSSSSSSLGAWANGIAANAAVTAAPAPRRISLSSSTTIPPPSSSLKPSISLRKPRPLPSSQNGSKPSPTSISASAITYHDRFLEKPPLPLPTSDPRLSKSSLSSSATIPGVPLLLPSKSKLSGPPLTYDSSAPISAQKRRQQTGSGPRRASDTLPVSVVSSTSTSALTSARQVKPSSSIANVNSPVYRVKDEPMEVPIPPPPPVNIPPPAPPILSAAEPNAMVVDEGEPDTQKANRVVKDFLKTLHVKMESQSVAIPPPPPSVLPPPLSHTPPSPPPSTKAPPHDPQLRDQRISNSPSIPWDLISVALSSTSVHGQSVDSDSADVPTLSGSKPSRASRPGSTSGHGQQDASFPSPSAAGGSAAANDSSKPKPGPGPAVRATGTRSSNSVLPTPPPSVPFSSASVFTGAGKGDFTQTTSPAEFPPSLTFSGLELPSLVKDQSQIRSQPLDSKVGVPLTPRTSSSVSPPVVVASSLSSSSSQARFAAHTKAEAQVQKQGKKEEVPHYEYQHNHPELDQLNLLLDDIMAKAQKAALQAQHLPVSSPAGMGSRAHLNSVTRSNTIANLTREAWDIKRHVTALVAREAVVIEELRKLEAKWVPEAVRIRVNAEDGSREKKMQDRIRKLEKQLEEERKLREEAENAIMDVRRECRSPFVVPSLLDALVDLSKLTTKAMRPPALPGSAAVSKSDSDSKYASALVADSAAIPAVGSRPRSSEAKQSQARELAPLNSNHNGVKNDIDHPNSVSSTRATNLPTGPRQAAVSLKGKEVKRETASAWDAMKVDDNTDRGWVV